MKNIVKSILGPKSPRPVDTIISSLHQTVEELKHASDHHKTAAAVLQKQANDHTAEAGRADRIAQKFTALIS